MVLEVFRCFVQRLGVRGVLLTFKTVVMYGHFDGSRGVWCRKIVETKLKFSIFDKGVKNGVMSTKTFT